VARKPGETFPSDHRRWFRVYEDIIDDPKLSDLSGHEFRAYFRLLAMLNRTKCRDGIITFDRYALMACTMRAQVRHSERTLSALAEHGLCSMSKDGQHYVITVCKWSELQELAPTEPQRDPNETPAPKTTPKTTTKTKERGEPSALVLASEMPDATTEEIWTATNVALKAYMHRSTGLTLTPARRSRLQRLVKDHGADAPLAAIHGYAATHLTKPPDPKFDPLRNFNPDTCWSAKLYGKYIDADTAAQGAGLTRPYAQPNAADEFRASVVRMTADVSRRHNQ